MFSSAPQAGSRASMATMYRGVNASTAIEGASPHKLVSMLYQAIAGEIAAARGAIVRKDIAEKGRAIGHAVRIVEEGLIAPLDLKGGGTIALNLRDLYDYIVRRLTMGNLHSDDAALADCAGLVQTLRDSWEAIAPQVDQPAPGGGMTARLARHLQGSTIMNSVLLNYYEAIEKASQDMLEAARVGNWDHVVKLEGACAVLIAQLKNTAVDQPLPPDEAQLKSRLMQRILVADAEIRQLAEPWLEDLDDILAGRPKTLH